MNEMSSSVIREVFGYINRFKGQIFVLKISDQLLDAPLFSLLIKDIVLLWQLGVKVIIVPGTKNSINRILKNYGKDTVSQGNVRITTDEVMPLVKLGVSDVCNTILTFLSENGAHGVVGNWIRAREIGVIDGVDFLSTGKVEWIKAEVLINLIEDNQIPILGNIGWSTTGKAYNISSDELAVFTAKALNASKLFFINNLDGIPEVKEFHEPELSIRPNGVYSSLELSVAQRLYQEHQDKLPPKARNMLAHGIDACQAGVNRVHIIGGALDGILLQEIFSVSGRGTMLHGNIHSNIRAGMASDIPHILKIMQPYVDSGVMIQRTPEMISSKINEFHVYVVDDLIQGCAAIHFYPNKTAEIEAVVVENIYANRGIGKRMVQYLLNKAKGYGSKDVFVLTTQTSDYFNKLGFQPASLEMLPEEKQKTYNHLRNSKVLIYRFD